MEGARGPCLYGLGRRLGRFAEEGSTLDKEMKYLEKAVVVDQPEQPPPSSLGSG